MWIDTIMFIFIAEWEDVSRDRGVVYFWKLQFGDWDDRKGMWMDVKYERYFYF